MNFRPPLFTLSLVLLTQTSSPAQQPTTPNQPTKPPSTALLLISAASFIWWFRRSSSPPKHPPRHSLASIHPDQADLLLGELFRREGYTIKLSAALPSPTLPHLHNLSLQRGHNSIPVSSKEWTSTQVTERQVAQLLETISHSNFPAAILVTTGTFSPKARQLAAQNSIELLDLPSLLLRIAAVQLPNENFFAIHSWLDNFTTEARIFDPHCHLCESPLLFQSATSTTPALWICPAHPSPSTQR
ncbi:MAG: restriction endonuclease, partial [Verrucomicrobiota bacterium]